MAKKKLKLPSFLSVEVLGTPQNQRLIVGLSTSLAIHAIVMAVHFTMPEMQLNRAPSLDVILVNARHTQAPKDPQALAQANLDGGGNSEEDVRASTPLPPQNTTRDGSDIVDMVRGQPLARQVQQEEILTQKDSPVAIAKVEPTPDEARRQQPAEGSDAVDAQAMALKLEAEIAAKTQAYNKRPRRKQIGARTKEHPYALYIEAWRAKAERIGDLNYPAAARGKQYGSLLMTVSIRKDGTIEKVEINRPSKYPVLNEAAVRIVRMGEPYAPFPPEIARETDVIDISRTWSFTNNKLTTTALPSPRN